MNTKKRQIQICTEAQQLNRGLHKLYTPLLSKESPSCVCLNRKRWYLKIWQILQFNLTSRHWFTSQHHWGPFQEVGREGKYHSQQPRRSLWSDLKIKVFQKSCFFGAVTARFLTNGQLDIVLGALAVFSDCICCLWLKREGKPTQSVVFAVHRYLMEHKFMISRVILFTGTLPKSTEKYPWKNPLCMKRYFFSGSPQSLLLLLWWLFAPLQLDSGAQGQPGKGSLTNVRWKDWCQVRNPDITSTARNFL